MINSEARTIIDLVARLEQQRKERGEEIAAVLKEAGAKGYDKALIRKAAAIKIKPPKARDATVAQHSLFDTYLVAAGLIPDDGGASPVRVEPVAAPVPFGAKTALAEMPAHDPETDEITNEITGDECAVVPECVDAIATVASQSGGAPPEGPHAGPTDETDDVGAPASHGATSMKSSGGMTSTPPPDPGDPFDELGIPAFLDRRAPAATTQVMEA